MRTYRPPMHEQIATQSSDHPKGPFSDWMTKMGYDGHPNFSRNQMAAAWSEGFAAACNLVQEELEKDDTDGGDNPPA